MSISSSVKPVTPTQNMHRKLLEQMLYEVMVEVMIDIQDTTYQWGQLHVATRPAVQYNMHEPSSVKLITKNLIGNAAH